MTGQPPDLPDGPQLRAIAMPAHANAGGSVFGGWTLSQMDLAGGSLTAGRADGQVVTVAIEAMRFLRPIAVGVEVSCYCTLEEVGESSVQVKIETWARGRGRGKAPEKVTEGIFVAVDEAGRPRRLPTGNDTSTNPADRRMRNGPNAV